MTAAGGYELAGAYENGQPVQSYGGGVCQVSTTLYNAVLKAELEVTQRSNHSMIVTYVKPSMDAANAGDYKDLKFVNNLYAPIYIEGYTVGKDIYFNIYRQETRPSNRKVTYESEVVSEEDPGTQFVATGDAVGSISTTQGKHMGYVARLWKIVTVDGVEQSRDAINKSTYKSSPKIVNVGTVSADPNATAAVNAALATGDEATIYATVAQYSGAGQTPAETPAETPADGSAEAAAAVAAGSALAAPGCCGAACWATALISCCWRSAARRAASRMLVKVALIWARSPPHSEQTEEFSSLGWNAPQAQNQPYSLS